MSNKSHLADYVFGKQMPSALPLEEGVLGAMLLDKDAYDNVMDDAPNFTEDVMYGDAHKIILKSIGEMNAKGMAIDLLTVTDYLKGQKLLQEIGGAYYLVELTNRVASAANVIAHARIIYQKYMLRSMIEVSSTLLKRSYNEDDAWDLLDGAENQLARIGDLSGIKGSNSIQEIASKLQSTVYERVKSFKDGNKGITGIKAGLYAIDKVTKGWQKKRSYLVAARPGMGKTSAMLLAALESAREGKPTAIFSLEMGCEELVSRLVSILTEEIKGNQILTGDMTDIDLHIFEQAIEELSKLPIYIDDTPSITVTYLKRKLKSLQARHGIEIAFIDYVQLMKGDRSIKGNRDTEIGEISRMLKECSKIFDIPVIALAQLSRAVETRGGAKRPILSDLRESGNLEQDADVVFFIYRPEYYQIFEDEEGNDLRGKVEFICAKHRYGETGTTIAEWVGDKFLFKDLDWRSKSQPTVTPQPQVQDNSTMLNNRPSVDDDEDLPF